MRTSPRSIGLLCGLLAMTQPSWAQGVEPLWSVAGYLQMSWPKQTETNRQIKQDINGALGTHYKTWDDVTNGNIGVVALRTVAPGWKVGVEADWSSGDIHGTEAVADFGLGTGSMAFKEAYHTYADLQIMIQARPFNEHGRVVPFFALGLGMSYERDTTTLRFTPDAGGGETELLRVKNHGWFPILNCGVGVDLYLTAKRTWFVEAEVGYSWCRLTRDATATGMLATGPTMRADTDDTGPNILLGIGRRF